MAEALRQTALSGVSDEPGTVTQLFAVARQGDAAAFAPLWEHFFPRLVGLARKRLSGRQIAGADAEDAAQAALVSFWRQLQTGRFLDDLRRDSLWNLLATITSRKVGKQLRHFSAQKRASGQVLNEAELASGHGLDQVVGSLPAQELDLQAAELIVILPEDLQELAVLRLLGHSTKEIAAQLDCTQRKVQRKLELVRLKWERSLTET
jgi:RNA polymerase sigma factor (sigma-70 family)